MYRYWGYVQALRLCTGTEAPYRHWGSVQVLGLCTGTEALRLFRGTEDLYRYWGSVQALRLCTGTEAVYRYWGTVQVRRLCTGTEALYRYWGSDRHWDSVQVIGLCTGTEALYMHCRSRTAHRRSRGILYSFFITALLGVRSQGHTPAALYPGKDPVPIVQGGGWAQGPIWTGAENLAPTGIRSTDRPVRSKSPYRVRYPGPLRRGKAFPFPERGGRLRSKRWACKVKSEPFPSIIPNTRNQFTH